MTNEYVKFFKNYKVLFKKYKKEIGKIPVQNGELTEEFQEFKDNIKDNELWEEWFKIEDIENPYP